MIRDARARLLDCPLCGKEPLLMEEADTLYFECRRWFGLRLCFGGVKATFIQRADLTDRALSQAVTQWNKHVRETEHHEPRTGLHA